MASAWWVKLPLIAAAGACGDVACRRRIPAGGLAALGAAALPRLRKPLFALAALIALSRVYLGVHFLTNIVVGSALGAAIGSASGWVVRYGRARA